MPSAIKSVKHIERRSQCAKRKEMRENTNNADSVAVMNLSRAFENKNADVALGMLKQPSVLGRLMRADKKRDIVCFYALHAVLLLVKDKDCNEVLQQMSDADIEDLKLLLRIAKSRNCPDQDKTLDYLSSMLVKFGKGDVVSDTMIISVRLYLDVSHVWEKSVVELDKWTDAVNSFVRVAPTVEQWMPLKELADKLGFETIGDFYDWKSGLKKTHPEIDGKDWFVNQGNKGKRFNPAHFAELKQWADEMWAEKAKKVALKTKSNKSLAGRPKTKKCCAGKVRSTKPVKVGKQTKCKIAVGNETLGDNIVSDQAPECIRAVDEPQKPMTLLDVVALEKMLTAWNEMLAAATQERDAAEQNYKDVSAQVRTVKNAAERGDMLKQMMSANDAVLAAADNVREIQEKIDRANALKQERAEAARILAEKDALIAAFLKEASVNKK